MKKYDNGVYREMTPEEIRQMQQAAAEYEYQERIRPLTESEVLSMFLAQNVQTLSVDDNTALRMVLFYPDWNDLCAESFVAEKEGFKFRYDGKLYKTRQENFTFQSQWIPGQGTSAIYSQIVETQAGTLEDPIDVPEDVQGNAFVYVIGKYYRWNGVIYKCQRQGDADGVEYEFPYSPDQLLSQYFVIAE